MHGTTIKVVNAQQPKLHNIFKNTKLKLLKTNAIWFNKMCKTKAFVGGIKNNLKMHGTTIKDDDNGYNDIKSSSSINNNNTTLKA